MRLTAKLALQQLKKSPKRTVWTIIGIALSAAMLAAISGFAFSGTAVLFPGETLAEILNRGGGGVFVIALVLGLIIAVSAVIVISNAFRVSAGERTHQFGILKSVGATKKQITATVLYEGVFLNVIGIPLGIAVGIAVQFGVLSIVNLWLAHEEIAIPFVVSLPGLAITALFAFALVLISAWLPARKAAKTSAVHAILHHSNVKIKARTKKSGKWVRLLFGVEGELAARQIKRNRRNFRATTLSLTISIVILLAASAFQSNLHRLTAMRFIHVDVDVWVEKNLPAHDRLEGSSTAFFENLTERLRDFPGAHVQGYGYVDYRINEAGGGLGRMRVLVLEGELYADLARQAGVPHGSSILINLNREIDALGIARDTNPYGAWVNTELELSVVYDIWDNTAETVPQRLFIDGHVNTADNPMIFYLSYEQPTVVVPQWEVRNFDWLVTTDNNDAFREHAETTVRGQSGGRTAIIDVELMMADMRLTQNIFNLFIYGFAGMLTLIGLTNVVSTISANTRLRAKEFAVLGSIGMTEQGIGKMLALESLLSSFRSLCIGIPLGLAAAYGVFQATQMGSYRFPFIPPWGMLAVCIVGVFTVTFAVMLFSASRLRGCNIIETIRSEGVQS